MSEERSCETCRRECKKAPIPDKNRRCKDYQPKPQPEGVNSMPEQSEYGKAKDDLLHGVPSKESYSCIEANRLILEYGLKLEALALAEGERRGYEKAKKVMRGENITDDICRSYIAKGRRQALKEVNEKYAEVLKLMPEYVNERTSFKLASKVLSLLRGMGEK